MIRAERGTLLEAFPYVRVGSGPRTLVVVPGVGDALFDGTYPPGTEWLLRAYFARYLDEHTVYLVSRPRGLPEGYTARESADDHAGLLADELGRADVLGISMGGMIATELAVARPDLVDRLVLANTGYRLADGSRDAARAMVEAARDRDWAAIRARFAAAMFSDWRAAVYPPIILGPGRILLPRPAVPADPRISLELVLEYDGRARLPDVDRPAFVFGGTRDPYFTEPIVRETARRLPNASLSLVEGAKHGAFHERKWTFDSRVTAFLARDA